MFSTIFDCLLSDAAILPTIGVGIVLTIILTVRYGRVQIHRNQFLVFWLIFPAACVLGYYYIRQTVDETNREQERTISEIARICAKTLVHHPGIHPPDRPVENDPRWERLRNLLLAWQNIHDDIDSVYILRQFREDTEPIMLSPAKVGKVFPRIRDEKEVYAQAVARAFQGQSAQGSLTGSDGKSFLFFVEPLECGEDGERSVLCLEARDWSDLVRVRRFWPHLFAGSFLVFVVTTQLIFVRRRLLSEKLRDTRVVRYEKALESLLAAQGLAKQEAEAKNLLLIQINTELKRPIIPILESSYLLLQQMRNGGNGGNGIANIDWNHIDMILKSNMKLQEVLDDVRLFVELEWNRLPAESVRFSLERLVREIRNDCQVRLQKHPGMTFLIDVRKPIPGSVLGDEAKIRRALQRLVDWVVDDASEGHVKLICSVSGTQLRLEMTDSGRGSSIPEERDSTFLSYRGSRFEFPSGNEKSLDFGMHVASRLVRFLDGKLSISTSPGRGRHYEITLPIGLLEESPEE